MQHTLSRESFAGWPAASKLFIRVAMRVGTTENATPVVGESLGAAWGASGEASPFTLVGRLETSGHEPRFDSAGSCVDMRILHGQPPPTVRRSEGHGMERKCWMACEEVE